MAKMKLTEIYGLKEGPFDDINKQLGGAQSVARDPRAKQQQQSQARDPSLSKTQSDLNRSKSIFDGALTPGGAMTVKSLIALLQKLPPNATIYEERGSELRAVGQDDIQPHDQGGPDDMDADNMAIAYPIVVFKAWA
jgi:hypothetical protein